MVCPLRGQEWRMIGRCDCVLSRCSSMSEIPEREKESQNFKGLEGAFQESITGTSCVRVI